MKDTITFIVMMLFIAVLVGFTTQLNFLAIEHCDFIGVSTLRTLLYAGFGLLLVLFMGNFPKLYTQSKMCGGNAKKYKKSMSLIVLMAFLSFVAAMTWWYALKKYKNPTVIAAILLPLTLVFSILFGYLFTWKYDQLTFQFTRWHWIGMLLSFGALACLSVGNYVKQKGKTQGIPEVA
jgi:hypothetical protein